MKNYLVFLFALLVTSPSVRADGVPLPVCSPVKRLGPPPKNPAVYDDTRIVLGEMTMTMRNPSRSGGLSYSSVSLTVPIRNVSNQKLMVKFVVAGFDAKGKRVVELHQGSVSLLPGAQRSISSGDRVEKSLIEQVAEWRGMKLIVKEVKNQ